MPAPSLCSKTLQPSYRALWQDSNSDLLSEVVRTFSTANSHTKRLVPASLIRGLQPACAHPCESREHRICRKMPFSTTFHGLAVTLPFGLSLKCACLCCPARLCLAGGGALVSKCLHLMSHLQATRCLPRLEGSSKSYANIIHALGCFEARICGCICHGHLFPLATM